MKPWRNAVVTATALRVCFLLLSVAAGILVARLGGADLKGVASTFTATATVIFLVTNVDLPQQALRWSRTTGDRRGAVRVVVRAWQGYALVGGVALLATYLWQPSAALVVLGGAAYLAGSQATILCTGVAGAVQTAIQALAQPLTMMVGTLVLWSVSALDASGMQVVLLVSYAAPVVLCALSISFALRGEEASSTEAPRVAALMKQGIPWQLARLAQLLIMRLATIVLFVAVGPASAGVYSVALSTAELAGIVPSQLANQLTHKATRGGQMDTRKVAMRALVASAMTAGILAVVAYPLIPVVYGAEFAGASLALLACLPAVLANAVVLVQTTGQRFTDTPVRAGIAGWAGVGASGVSMWPLVQQWGVSGAGAATSFGCLVSAVLITGLARRDR